MLQTKSVDNQRTIGEKMITALRQPLFTIPLPNLIRTKYQGIKKSEPAKAAEPKKAVKKNNNHSALNNMPYRRVPVRNTTANIKNIQYVFTPVRNQEEFAKILFVLRACEKNGTAEYTNVLHVEHTTNGSRLIATDGKRMHVTEIRTKIKPGNYKPVIRKDSITLGTPAANISFPNWQRVVPVDVVKRGCINIDNSAIYENGILYNSFTRMSGEKVNPKYLSDLAKKSWVIYCQNEKHKAVLLKQYDAKETYAVIMPLQ